MSESKAREYFLADSHLRTETGQEFRIAGTFPEVGIVTGNFIHVIEKSAYDKAVEALKEIVSYRWCPSCKNEESIGMAEEALRDLGVE